LKSSGKRQNAFCEFQGAVEYPAVGRYTSIAGSLKITATGFIKQSDKAKV
jgi:hypothetical protein